MLNIYRERQSGNKCGIHALNNLFQYKIFSSEDMSHIMKMESPSKQIEELSPFTDDIIKDCHKNGNYDSFAIFKAMLIMAPKSKMITLDPKWNFICKTSVLYKENDDDKYVMIIRDLLNVNINNGYLIKTSNHYFVYRKIDNDWYYINSIGDVEYLDSDLLRRRLHSQVVTNNPIYKVIMWTNDKLYSYDEMKKINRIY